MESFATKKMPFKFSAPGEADKGATAESAMPAEPTEAAGYTPDELGSVLSEAIKSGSGDAVYEAVAKIVQNCG